MKRAEEDASRLAQIGTLSELHDVAADLSVQIEA